MPPHARLTSKVRGKTLTESFPSPAAQRKAERETAKFRRYQALSPAFVAVNERICRQRPVEDTLTAEEKTAAAIQQEVAQEVSRLLQVVFASGRKSGRVDLEAVEMAVRGAMCRAGASAVGRLLSLAGPHPAQVAYACGAQGRDHDHRPKRLLTALESVGFERAYYVSPRCHQGHSPRDLELDVEGPECSPGVRRMPVPVGGESSFAHGREQLELLAGLEVTAKAVERHAEAIGPDIAAREQAEIHRVQQLELPEVCAASVPVLYIQMDGRRRARGEGGNRRACR